MDLNQITPLILTFNEEPNLRATLSCLQWAKQIIVVDSGSTDQTLAICAEFPQVTVHYRAFDHFADQCNFGLSKIVTPWTLSLDADYACPVELPSEVLGLMPTYAGFLAKFRYCIFGRPLRSSLYPPRVVLYQTKLAHYVRDGHAHRVCVDGEVGTLTTRLLHDDRKAVHGWFLSQAKYARLEADKLNSPTVKHGWKDGIRKKIVFAPILTLFYCLLYKGLLLDGWPGWYYTGQRVLAELMLSLALLDNKLRANMSARS